MIRNLKVLGVALAAVFALSAIAASAASAQTIGVFTSTGPTALTGTENGVEANRLTAFGAFVECPGSIYTAAKYNVTPHVPVPSGVSTATLIPHYKQTTAGGAPNCKGSLNTSATVDMNGCDYVLHLGETTGVQVPPNTTYGATVDVVCPVGSEITVTIWLSEAAHTSEPTKAKCTLHVPSQNGLKGLHVTHTTGTSIIHLKGTVTGIKVKQTRHSILCPAGTETLTGEFHLDASATGKNEAGETTPFSISH